MLANFFQHPLVLLAVGALGFLTYHHGLKDALDGQKDGGRREVAVRSDRAAVNRQDSASAGTVSRQNLAASSTAGANNTVTEMGAEDARAAYLRKKFARLGLDADGIPAAGIRTPARNQHEAPNPTVPSDR